MGIAILGAILGTALAVLAFVTPRECCPDRAAGLTPREVEIVRAQAREETALPSLRLQLVEAGRDAEGRLVGTVSLRTVFGVEYGRARIRAGATDYIGRPWVFAAVWLAFAFAEAGMVVLVLVALADEGSEPNGLTARASPH